MTMDDARALREAAAEIEDLRRRNELLYAKVQVMELFRLALTARPDGDPMGYSPDVVPHLRRIATVTEKEAAAAAEKEAEIRALATERPEWRRVANRLLRFPVGNGTLGAALEGLMRPPGNLPANCIDSMDAVGLALRNPHGSLCLSVPMTGTRLENHFDQADRATWTYALRQAPADVLVDTEYRAVGDNLRTRCLVFDIEALLPRLVPMEAAEAAVAADL